MGQRAVRRKTGKLARLYVTRKAQKERLKFRERDGVKVVLWTPPLDRIANVMTICLANSCFASWIQTRQTSLGTCATPEIASASINFDPTKTLPLRSIRTPLESSLPDHKNLPHLTTKLESSQRTLSRDSR
jgi:hypothetical protein